MHRPDLAAARLISWFFSLFHHAVRSIWCSVCVRVVPVGRTCVQLLDSINLKYRARPNLIKLAIMQSKPDGARRLCWRHDFVYSINRASGWKSDVFSLVSSFSPFSAPQPSSRTPPAAFSIYHSRAYIAANLINAAWMIFDIFLPLNSHTSFNVAKMKCHISAVP